jgi:hypothetical protein
VDVEGLADRFRAALADRGLLLVHDTELPCATAIAAGAPFGGSWWAHPLAHPIYDALQLVEDEVTRAKLIRGKVTLVARRLWPALVAVGTSRDGWQLDGLSPASRDLLAVVEESDAPVRPPHGAAKAAGELERRLLVHGDQVHTESGRHAKVLQPWRAWAQPHGLADPAMTADDAIAAFEAAVAGWPATRGRRLLPFP